ncbi:hypothetical protein GGI25_005529 [Coemansia spiralis]|uniref:WD40 repeat-like protein n=2 Tax=Coemansia TaxID=4863 RepID=A0A9W8G336_9FUNG|nr:hypothetical protein EDC05_004643 [Coemansia umbellata]KAJ2623848.1 hypothetical protein GGI26_002086 [Coemansia sp. RSA 1358]KAJ2671370.1 hypothetical protein GGI25_005529 [Coemansia spiralis]
MAENFGYISVQPDWTIDAKNALGGVEGTHKFWVSAYRQGSESIHDDVVATGTTSADGSKLISLDTSDSSNISAEYVGSRQLRLSSRTLGIPPSLYTTASRTVTCSQIARGTGVRCFDVSRYGGLLVACGDDGAMDVYDTGSGVHRVQLNGHFGDVTCCQFFPSGQVILSGATDMRLKIWSASDGTNPVTLIGHRAAITDVAIVGVGKNVLSAAKDGTVRLWHCGSASVVHTFDISKHPINKIDLVVRSCHDGNNVDTTQQLHDTEFETDGKVLAVACEDGRALLFDLLSKEKIAEFGSLGGLPVRAVAYDAVNEILFTGISDGTISVWSLAEPVAPMYSFRRNQSAISAVHLVRTSTGDTLLCAGTEDGQLFIVSLNVAAGGKVASAEVVEDLIAFDVDPVSQVRVTPSSRNGATRQSIWAAGQCSRVCEF